MNISIWSFYNVFNKKNIELLEQQVLITESIDEVNEEDFDNTTVNVNKSPFYIYIRN